jgi:hypothetical protein
MPTESCLLKGWRKEPRSRHRSDAAMSGTKLLVSSFIDYVCEITREDKRFKRTNEDFHNHISSFALQPAHRRRIHAGEICNGRRQATVVEKMPTKGKAASPLRVQSPVDESRAAHASREGLTNCKPSNLYSNGVVDDPREWHHG